MVGPDYPDREEWPRYWRAIRRGVVAVLVVGTIGLVTGAFVVAQLVIDWLTALWDRRLHR